MKARVEECAGVRSELLWAGVGPAARLEEAQCDAACRLRGWWCCSGSQDGGPEAHTAPRQAGAAGGLAGWVCGSTSWLAEGRAGGEPDIAASPALHWPWSAS